MTDRQTDGSPGEKSMSPNTKGGDITTHKEGEKRLSTFHGQIPEIQHNITSLKKILLCVQLN